MTKKQKEWIDEKCKQLKDYCFTEMDNFKDEDWDKIIEYSNKLIKKSELFKKEAIEIIMKTLREIDYEDFRRKQSKHRPL